MLRTARREFTRRVGPPAVRLIARTWRIQVIGEARWSQVESSAAPYVLLCWHEALLPVMWHHRDRGIAAVVSGARDGQYLAALAVSLGYGIIKGSSTRGGGRALLETIRALQRGTPVGITPDGPRGPRRVAKPGAVAAAARSGAMIVPVHAESRPAWRANSWDGFLVPPPFAWVRMVYGEPFRVDAGPTAEQAATSRAAHELDDAARLAAWPVGAETLIG